MLVISKTEYPERLAEKDKMLTLGVVRDSCYSAHCASLMCENRWSSKMWAWKRWLGATSTFIYLHARSFTIAPWTFAVSNFRVCSFGQIHVETATRWAILVELSSISSPGEVSNCCGIQSAKCQPQPPQPYQMNQMSFKSCIVVSKFIVILRIFCVFSSHRFTAWTWSLQGLLNSICARGEPFRISRWTHICEFSAVCLCGVKTFRTISNDFDVGSRFTCLNLDKDCMWDFKPLGGLGNVRKTQWNQRSRMYVEAVESRERQKRFKTWHFLNLSTFFFCLFWKLVVVFVYLAFVCICALRGFWHLVSMQHFLRRILMPPWQKGGRQCFSFGVIARATVHTARKH